MPKGMPKVNLLDPFSDTGRPGSTYFAFLVVSVRCPKNMFFQWTKNRPNIFKNESKGREKGASSARGFPGGGGLGGPGRVSGHARDRTG